MPYKPRPDVGIGFCEVCSGRIFIDENFREEPNGDLTCSICVEEAEVLAERERNRGG